MGRKRDEFVSHGKQSITAVADELRQIADRLEASVKAMDFVPPITELQVRYEKSLEVGLHGVRTWSNEVSRAAMDARRVGVRQNGHVSDDGPE